MSADELTRTTVRHDGGEAVVDLMGDINAAAEESMERAWAEAVAAEPDSVVLDFGDAGYINSTGIALIVGMLAKARARGVPMSARGLTPHYREIFEITRLADFMEIRSDDTARDGTGRSTT